MRREASAGYALFGDPKAPTENLVAFLDRQRVAPEVAERYRVKYELLNLMAGEAAFDVGCGAGADLYRVAGEVEPSGRAVGLDVNPAMVEAVRERAAAGLTSVEAQKADGGPLPFGDGTGFAARGWPVPTGRGR